MSRTQCLTDLQYLLLLGLALLISPVDAGQDTSACDSQIPALTSGYGADGPYAVEQQSLDNPGFSRKPVQVYFPHGLSGSRPVVFFAHGYGANDPETYADLIRHFVSRGNILVYSTYPALLVNEDQRYDALWQGFQAAAQHFRERMDLSRVAFIGHSYGGGAIPAMAYRGLVQQHWGQHGAMLAMLAPWYSCQASNAQLSQLPDTVPQLFEVYQDDTLNDWRMAIDLYTHSHAGTRYFFEVQSSTVGGCSLTADHSTPGRNPSLRLKQYAVFKPLDALLDSSLNGSPDGGKALAAMTSGSTDFSPLRAQAQPTATAAESHYRFAWSDRNNPRK